MNLNLNLRVRRGIVAVAEIEGLGCEGNNRRRVWKRTTGYRLSVVKMVRYLILKLGFGWVSDEDDEEDLQHTGGCDCQATAVSKPLNSSPCCRV
ncbi:unnamed protein product [Prunus armeniaca]|uniref:Uncharacterized protein n=1 Tax=Prunus armeniaca TaxID=36596 RepID=A0A6J5VDF3_PRUAR|nr:unnamed protein product [Prunus armeniaca]